MMDEKRRVALLSVVAAFVLVTMKLTVGLRTGSLGILSEALHSGLDMIAAIITFVAVKISCKPADKIYHYGHGKIENLSALIETLLLLITCSWIIYEAIDRLVTGRTHIEVNIWSFIIVIVSILVDFGRSRALYRVARKHRSQALEADALHFSTDIWSSAVVLFGLAGASFGFYFADSIAALVVASFVLLISYRLGKRAVEALLDKAPVDLMQKVTTLLNNFPDVKYFHSVKIRTSGADTFIKINIHFDPDLKLFQVHDLCDRIERELKSAIPGSEIYIHAEPQDFNHIISDLTESKELKFP